MKFQVQFKDPDGVQDSLDEAAKDLTPANGLDDDERAAVMQLRREKIGGFVGKWIRYGEYLTVEFDTDAGTVTVLEAR